MTRYIDVDTLLKAIVGEYGRNSATEMLVIGVLNNLPTADVVEVVRCEKCACRNDCNKEVYIEGGYSSVSFCSCGEKAVNYESSKFDRK